MRSNSSKGEDNGVADALSRVPGSSCMPEIPLEVSLSHVEYKAITFPILGGLMELRREMEKDDWIQNKIQEVISSQASNTHTHSASSQLSKFHNDNGFLKHKGRIVLSPFHYLETEGIRRTPCYSHCWASRGAQNLS